MDLTTLLLQLGFTLVFAAVLVGWFARPATDPKEVASWARGHALELTDHNRAMVTYYVRLAVTLRVIGGVGGLVLGAAFDDAIGLDTSSGAGFWIWILLGWLLGASWAEYRLTRPASSDHAASLTPRDVRDYLSPRLYAAPPTAAVVVLALCVVGILAPEPTSPHQPAPPPTSALVLAAIGAVTVAGLVVLAVRTVVARRQPTGPADVVAADDAIRASAVHHLAGGGAAAILLIASQVSWAVLLPYGSTLAGLGVALTFAFLLAAVASWRWYAYRHWRVRRSAAPVAARP